MITPEDPAVLLLKQYFDTPVRPFMTVDFGRERKSEAVSIIVDYAYELTPDRLVNSLQQELPQGYIAFRGTDRWLGEEKHHGIEVVLARAESQFEAIHLAESSGINQDISSEQVIHKLREYDTRYGIQILSATTDAVTWRFKRLPEDLDAYQDDLEISLRPDITVPRSEVIQQILTHKVSGVWWD